jgi:hypothetical protein
MERGKIREAVTTSILISLLLITTCAFVKVQALTYAFTATISPTGVATNQLATYIVTITDTGTSGLGSAVVAIPSGFTVSEPITIVAPTTSWNHYLLPSSINLTASGGGAKISTNQSLVFTFAAVAPASPGVTVWTTTANSGINWGSTPLIIDSAQPTVTVTGNPLLVAPIISAFPLTIDQGQASLLSQTAGPSGGTPPYTYQWSESFNGEPFSAITGANSASYTFSTTTSTATGTWAFKLNVTDSSSVPATVSSNQVNVVVNAALAAPAVTATPDVVYQNQPSALTSSTVTTGTSPYTLQWFQRAPSDDYVPVGTNSPSYSFPGSATVGTWTFVLQVTDGAGVSINSSSAGVIVTSTPSFTITVTAGAHGTINPGTTSIIQGGSQSFTIAPQPGCQIADVLVDGVSVGAVTSYSFTNVNADHTLAATFTQIEYTLTVSTVGSGSVAMSPSQPTYHYDDVVQLTATSAGDWSFSGWTGGFSSSLNPVSVIINGSTSVTATFVQNGYSLTVSTVGSGIVSKSPDKASYNLGDVVALTATPSAGWSFGGWSGDFSSSTNPISVIVNGTTSATATFTQIEYTLEASTVGSGSVVKAPSQSTYHYGDVVQLTATPVVGWSFSSWSGDFSSSLNPVSVTINGSTSVTATFVQNAYALTVSTVGGGSVNKSPDQASYNLGDVVTLTATPSPGWSFSGWSGTFSSSVNPVSVTVNGTASVTATFIQNVYTLTLSTVGSGSVALNNTGPYHLGDVVRLTANPSVGWGFSVWSSGLSGSANPAELNITSNLVVVATFIQTAYSLTVYTVGSGSVVKFPDQVSYHYGDVVQLTAIPASDWRFAGWNGGLTGTLNPSSITINSSYAVTAVFLVNQYIITSSAGEGGSIDPSGATIVDYGGSQAFNITPSVGYHVVGVLVNGTSVGPVSSYTVSNVTGDTMITASFAVNGLTIEASAGPHGSINPNGIVAVAYGDDQGFTISPDTGYHVAGVLVDGISVGAVTSYTFAHVTAVHNISVNFDVNSYIINAFAGPHGTINPSGMVLVNWNGTLTFTIIPDAGYYIENVMVDGVSVSSANSYTFAGVVADHNITADFALSTYFFITVTSSHGMPTPSAQVNAGDSLDVSVTDIEGDTSHRWVCTGYSIDGGTPVSGTSYTFQNVQANHAITFYWQEQYRLTVNTQAGTASGTGWYNTGTTATASILSNTITSESGTRQIFTSWSGDATGTALTSNPITMNGPKTATANWKTQYYLTVTSAYGNPTGQGWYDAGTTATFNVEVPTSNSSDTRIVFTWKGTEGGYTGTAASSTVTMNRAITEEATWITQYQVTFALTGNVLQADAPQTEWVTSGAAATGAFVSSITNSAGNKRSIFVGDNRPSVITAPITITGTYKTQYLVRFSQKGLDSNVSGTVVTVLGEPKAYDQLPNSAWIDLGGAVTFSYAATVEDNNTGEQYILRSTNFTSPLAINEPTTIQAEYELQTSFDLNTIVLPAILILSLSLPPIPILAWQRRKRKITPIAGEGGYISPSTAQKIERGGDSAVFIITARYGFKIIDVVIDNRIHLGAVRTYKFTDVNENHTISAKFSRN